MQPSEFWQLTPHEFWLLYNEYAVIKGIKKKVGSKEINRMKSLFELPEARPSKALR